MGISTTLPSTSEFMDGFLVDINRIILRVNNDHDPPPAPPDADARFISATRMTMCAPQQPLPLASWHHAGRRTSRFAKLQMKWNWFWVVVSNIFYVHPYLGKIPILTNIFSTGLKPPTRIPMRITCFCKNCWVLQKSPFFPACFPLIPMRNLTQGFPRDVSRGFHVVKKN